MNEGTGMQVFPTTTWSAGAGCHGACGQKLFVKDGRLVKIEGDENASWNQGRSCPRALALTQYVYHPDRITTPLKRVGKRGEGKFEPISWDEALDFTASKLREIKEKNGPDSIGFLTSARVTNEENYLLQKFARAAVGTNNVDHCARL